MRERLPELAPYRLLDRGRYEHATLDPAAFADVTAALLAVARRAAPERDSLAVLDLRAMRFGAGGYSLAHHDPRGTTAVHAGRFPLELSLDLSLELSASAGVGEAGELHYRRRGYFFFRALRAPGSFAIVELSPAVTSNQTYLSLRTSGAEILRLVALVA